MHTWTFFRCICEEKISQTLKDELEPFEKSLAHLAERWGRQIAGWLEAGPSRLSCLSESRLLL